MDANTNHLTSSSLSESINQLSELPIKVRVAGMLEPAPAFFGPVGKVHCELVASCQEFVEHVYLNVRYPNVKTGFIFCHSVKAYCQTEHKTKDNKWHVMHRKQPR